jgi:hypothetical protein
MAQRDRRRMRPSPVHPISAVMAQLDNVTAIEPRLQPYFKLHGSMNWRNPSGGHLLVMGGNKPTTIQRHPILMWYAQKFVEQLSMPGARLMVIGYGFRDN